MLLDGFDVVFVLFLLLLRVYFVVVLSQFLALAVIVLFVVVN